MEPRVYLERPSRRRRSEFLSLVHQSRRFHKGWVYPPATEIAFSNYIKKYRKASSRGFFVCIEEDRKLAGVANLGEIVRGGLQGCYLGYYAFEPAAGHGYMTEGLSLVLDVAFGELKLHRVEANIQPANTPSIELVKRLGFRLEGYSPKYLKIGGRWRDHERWAILAEEWKKSRARARRRV